VVLQRFLQGRHPGHPLGTGRIELVDLLDQLLGLHDLLVVVLTPLREDLVSRADLARHRAIERPLFHLLVNLQLRLQLGPERLPVLRPRRLDLAEHPLGHLMLVLEKLDRVHRGPLRGSRRP
jgi:hypothetical protein